MKKEFFNLRASEKISLWRSIPDTRDVLYVNKEIFYFLFNFDIQIDVNRLNIRKIYQVHRWLLYLKMNVGHRYFELFILF
jgi:hypothetical protein